MRDPGDIQVLFAGDDYLVSDMIRGLLEETGYHVIGEAADGREAVEMTQRLHPDVVLMDVRMPDLDGIQATQRIFERCPTPVVILGDHETPELIEQASAVGAGAYLVRPLNAGAIKRAITIAIARFRDLVELHNLNAELQERNEELDAFAQTVAHDLKDILARIVGYAGALEENFDELPGDEIRGYLQTISQSGLKMSSIIDAMLLLTGVRQVQVEIQDLDMGIAVAEAMHRLSGLAEQRKAKAILPDRWPAARGYSPWVEAIWVNYISNAIKYGGTPPRVELGATVPGQGYVRFWVRDNGLGIPPEMHGRLFKPFTRLGQAQSVGHGLGLSIVRRIVARLGGRAGFESTVGEGSVFWFTLPAVQPELELDGEGRETNEDLK